MVARLLVDGPTCARVCSAEVVAGNVAYSVAQVAVSVLSCSKKIYVPMAGSKKGHAGRAPLRRRRVSRIVGRSKIATRAVPSLAYWARSERCATHYVRSGVIYVHSGVFGLRKMLAVAECGL